MPTEKLHYRTLWLTLGWLLVATVWYLSLTPKPPKIDLGIEFFDKISHFTAYAAMMGWFIQLYSTTRTRLFYAAGFIGMGMVIEILQGMGPARLFEYADMLANSLGVVGIFMLQKTGIERGLLYIEVRLLKKNNP